MVKTLTSFLNSSEISEYTFKDKKGRIYRPIRIELIKGPNPQLFIVYLNTKVIKTNYISIEEANNHEFVDYYSRPKQIKQ